MLWVEGVHVSSIVNSSYPDYFEPVYFFFLQKGLTHTKRKSANKNKNMRTKNNKGNGFLRTNSFNSKSRLFTFWCFFACA